MSRAFWRCDFDALDIRLEQPVGDAGYFSSRAAFSLGHTAAFDVAPEIGFFLAECTHSRH